MKLIDVLATVGLILVVFPIITAILVLIMLIVKDAPLLGAFIIPIVIGWVCIGIAASLE